MATSALAAVDFGQGVSSAWSSVATFVPKLLAFLVILFIGWLIAKALSKAVSMVLEKVGFNRLLERGGFKQMLARSQFDASGIISKIVYYAILLIALQFAFGVFGPNPVSALLNDIVAWLPRAIVAIVIVVIAGAVAKAVKDLIGNALGGVSYGKVLATIASVFIWGLGAIAALNQIGVATAVTMPVLIAVLATVGGIAVVGVGGGLIKPMQQRWETWLGRAEAEIPAAKAQAEAYQRGREDAGRSGEVPTERTTVNQPVSAGHHAVNPNAPTQHQQFPPSQGQVPQHQDPGQRPPGGNMPPPPEYR
ncbi:MULTISPECIES: mechanosensitive ion channel family protein [Amycolatopsis]|uniref:TM helix repeat-containing protein n=1 Tax=Amycolatopsis japonica TaxID=208439 RepID=A0A075UPA4_9PSEU|nr:MULTISPECIES: hypothetical protein [Amycolatopsis]AIG74191.1 TM helix repeat-containing protein [Amycolatopsis japonica]OKJ92187.1 hypothetical protein AMK34_35030 [Amycolatopsis sp. CB00013]